MNSRIALYIFMFLSAFANAQNEPVMADGMRSDGKIFVVITVISVVFVCIAAYLIIIDRKVKKLEDKLKK
jgi:hypothetical protein